MKLLVTKIPFYTSGHHNCGEKDVGFVKDERQEQFIYYYIDRDNELLKDILEKIILNSENYNTIKKDLENLQKGDKYTEMLKNKCNPNS